MATNAAALREEGFGETQRRDTWWVQPLAMGAAFVAFIIYATFRGLWNAEFEFGHGAKSNDLHPESAYFLSPFYSPLLPIRQWLPWAPAWLGPAIFVMWMPAGFRLTCYYGRKAYYRALFGDPPACAVAEFCKPHYKGERGFWAFQNLHRYFLYFALLLVCMHIYHVVEAMRWPAEGGMTFGMSVGTLVLALDLVFLAAYVFSCHSLRHLVGGGRDCFSGSSGESRYKAWRFVTKLNDHHGLFFWLSLFTVGFADFYIWMVASGRIHDLRLI